MQNRTAALVQTTEIPTNQTNVTSSPIPEIVFRYQWHTWALLGQNPLKASFYLGLLGRGCSVQIAILDGL